MSIRLSRFLFCGTNSLISRLQSYDGYQAILEANSGNSREDELEAMRRARFKIRQGQSLINEIELD